MTAPDKNGASGYRGVYPEVVRQSLLQMHASLVDSIARQRLRSAYRLIHARLCVDPLGFGEPKYRLEHLRLAVRSGSIDPLVVGYAVHDEQRLVFVRGFVLLSGP